MPLTPHKTANRNSNFPFTPGKLPALLVLLLLAAGAAAQQPKDESPLLLQDVPIFYGEAGFTARMEKLPSGRSTPLGLLLSGGSARAFAHIGVLKALEERDLPPDFIVTDSMGSIVGILYGAGLAPDEILELIKQIDLSSLFQLELPLKGGLLNTRLFTELVAAALPYDDLGELPIPVIVVTEDLRTKRAVVLADGNIEKVLAASFALPVYFNPVDLYGHKLIDGGISNIAPVEFPFRYTDNVIVATTFYRRRLNLNNPITILNVTMDITKTRAAIRSIKEYDPIWIRCNVETFSFMDWAALDEIVRRGYDSTLTQLENNSRAAELTRVPTGYLSPHRKKMRASLQDALHRYRRIGTVSYTPLDWGGKAGIEASGGPAESLLLTSRNRFFAGAFLRHRFGTLYLRGFAQPQWLNKYQMVDEEFGGMTLGLDWAPFGRIKLQALMDANFIRPGRPPGDLQLHSLYGSGGISVPLTSASGVTYGPFIRSETTADEEYTVDQYAVTAGLSAARKPLAYRALFYTAEAGVFLNEERRALQSELFAELRLFRNLSLRQRLFSRVSPGSGPVDYYPGDYYRGSYKRELLADYIISNTSLALQFPSWTPTFGEMLIMDAFSFGPFFDLRASREKAQFIGGASLDASLSLIGLNPLQVHLDYGWRQGGDGRFSFYLSL